jgi:hypothetical protein
VKKDANQHLTFVEMPALVTWDTSQEVAKQVITALADVVVFVHSNELNINRA